ncbi:sugar transferase [Panacibacter ginsenosidivorans]|nr:sugar transferase [Panacibacter ginsenosidivorans]
MNLDKHYTLYFFESAVNNIIVNVALTGLIFISFPHDPGAYLIPLLLLVNTMWFLLFMIFNYFKNNGALFVSKKAEALLFQLISFYLLNSIFWIPGMNRKFFLIIYGVFSLSVLLLHFFGKALKKILLLILYKKDRERPEPKIISRLKDYFGNEFYDSNFQPSISGFENKKMNTLLYNSKGDISKISRVSINGEIQIDEVLENAEYTFDRVNLGDRIAVGKQYLNPYNIGIKGDLAVKKVINRLLKRLFDIIVSLFVIVFFLSWMVPLIGLLIKMESRGPVLFRQLRSGRNNRPFWCYKFRSMHVNESSDELQATKGDSRVTAIGAFLRKTSIDEFPQFINVLKGEMSIVGPRPHMLLHTEFYGARIDNYMKRLTVRQGLTGWAQVKGYRGETADIRFMEERVYHDLWYTENGNLWLDIKIIFLTLIKIFNDKSRAY